MTKLGTTTKAQDEPLLMVWIQGSAGCGSGSTKDYSKSIQDANVWLELVYLDSSEDREQQPYVLALQHMSSQRLGISDYENLAADASHLDANVWLELIHLYSSEDGEEQPYVLA